MRRRFSTLVALLGLVLAASAVAIPTPASAVPSTPWDGNPISHGLGPLYGETWCAPPAPGSSIALQQGYSGPAPNTLALIPQEAIGCTLAQFQTEAANAGVPNRMSYSVIGQSALGRDLYGVVVNALETPEQQRDYDRWQQLRAIDLTDPVSAQSMLATWGADVKMPIFIEANIHGGEEEGTDAMMQAIRDLTVTPYGDNPTVDEILDHAIVIVIPTENPDGRFLGTGNNANGINMNRDFLVQSQSEVRAEVAFQHQWLAPVGLAMHCCGNPTLIDGLTKPHNPGIDYDLFAYWNQRRLDANEAALAAVGMGITRPVNQWCAFGDAPDTGYCTEVFIASTANGGATELGNTVTINTTANHNLAVSDSVTIAGVGVADYNGTYTVASIVSTTKFTYANPVSGLANSGGGAVWSPSYGVGTPPGPSVAEGWDDWGPFYTQTYMAFFGVDSSTVEMCSTTCDGRFGSKRAQYLAFYSSSNFWIDNRDAILHDQAEIFRRGLTDAARPSCCTDSLLVARGFDEANQNWMVPYPKAFVIPFDGSPAGKPAAFDRQRSDAEANRLVQWLLDNGILVRRLNKDFTWQGTTFPKKSYVVWMNQPFRGIALTALDPGQDVSNRISQLYAAPGAWSHGQLWGADVVEIPPGDAAFNPFTTPLTAPNDLLGGVRGGGLSDWYSVTLKGVSEVRAVLDLLRNGVDGEVAEAGFTSTTGGPSPAGTLIFPNDAATVAALATAGKAAGIYFERNKGVTKPPTTKLTEAPKVAILVNSAAPANSDTSQSLREIFGSDADFVSVVLGANSLQNAATDPLLGYDVIYNTGQAYPSAPNATAQARLNAFFARGGGYIGTSVSGTNFTFLTGAVPALVAGSFTQGSSPAAGGIALWNNASGPVTGGYPAQDYLYLPSNITYFSATPTGAVIDGRYLNSTSAMFVAGLWLNRDAAAANASMAVHGNTTANSRYVGLATNPFSRMDAEREWLLIGQAALWSNLTDEA